MAMKWYDTYKYRPKRGEQIFAWIKSSIQDEGMKHFWVLWPDERVSWREMCKLAPCWSYVEDGNDPILIHDGWFDELD